MSEAETVQGVVKSLNFAPKGEIDGLLIDARGGLVQVNLPPEMGEHAKSLIGQEITVQTKPEPKVADHPKGDHPVFKFGAFVDAAGKATAFDGQKHQPPHAGHAEAVEVSGTVQRLNYAKHGEANGVVLDSGDFVHLKPDGMKKVTLEVGQQVVAKGKGTASPQGGKALDAEVVNGIELGPKKPH